MNRAVAGPPPAVTFPEVARGKHLLAVAASGNDILLAVQKDEERQYQVLNLKELHRKSLKLFPPEVEKIYLDPNGCGR